MANTQTFELIAITPDGGKTIQARFNPTQYTLEKGNQIAEFAVPGLGAPILQFVRGNSRTLSLDLFFDVYEPPDPAPQGLDLRKDGVRAYTNQVYNLLEIDPDTHAPPRCTIQWGNHSPSEEKWVLERVSGRFTLFFPDGRPARATLSVSFKEYIPIDIQVRKKPNQSADHAKRYTVRQGDTLSSIAYAEYGDAATWRPIARRNAIANPRTIQPGLTLIIPPLRDDER
jgi:hypothetical protein